MAKGGGSANKSFLYQETKAVLNPKRMLAFLDEKIRSLGTAACPPYHLAVVIGGTSAEYALKTAKYASAHYLDNLPTSGSLSAHGFRDLELEEEVFKLTQSFGIGAQFGGKYFCHDVRVVRLPRHGASCPVALAVSCSADRQALGKITAEGVFLEQLETDPAQYMPDAGVAEDISGGRSWQIDLNRPMPEILAELSRHPVKTRLSLTGPLVVARDIAHAKIKERLDAGEEMPAYLRDHAVYYAGPAKTPDGLASGSFGPTTAGRMDSYVEQFQAAGGSMVMLAKGNRSKVVTEACESHGGFYLGSIGGPAARLAQDCIRSVEVLEYPELGMEAVWKIEVEDFPAFIVVDDKGNDFFTDPGGHRHRPALRHPGALGRLRCSWDPGRTSYESSHRWLDSYDVVERDTGQAAALHPRAINASSIWSKKSSGWSRSPRRGRRSTTSPEITREFWRRASPTMFWTQAWWMPSISTTKP